MSDEKCVHAPEIPEDGMDLVEAIRAIYDGCGAHGAQDIVFNMPFAILCKFNELRSALRVLREERDRENKEWQDLQATMQRALDRERESRKQAEAALRGWLKFNADTCWIVDDETGPERAALVEESNEALAIPQEPAEPESGK